MRTATGVRWVEQALCRSRVASGSACDAVFALLGLLAMWAFVM